MLEKFISLENLEYFWSKVKKIIIDKDQAMDERVKVFESWNFATEDDVNKILNGTYVPSPEDPETPADPETPTENVGTVTEDNSIVVDETQLENGTYTLRYIDSEDNIIDNFNEITSFEINK
jgi:hypothetical protein